MLALSLRSVEACMKVTGHKTVSCSSATPEQTNLTFGWGLRFQLQPSGPPNDILLHINLRDASNLLQPDALGILGVNLI